jgi:pyruvate formate lyase activating enzyme
LAFTFNEPIVWAEYILDVAQVAHRSGLFVALNTNGYILGRAAEDLLRNVDVVKVDIKGFDDDVYSGTCGGSLKPVLELCAQVRRSGKHLELSYLMIPGITDGLDMVARFGTWAMGELGPDVPIHLYRFQPSARMTDRGPEPISRMLEARDLVMGQGVNYVYLGGETEGRFRNTLCPNCSTEVIMRSMEESEPGYVLGERVSRFCPSFSKVENRLLGTSCPRCGGRIAVTYWPHH